MPVVAGIDGGSAKMKAKQNGGGQKKKKKGPNNEFRNAERSLENWRHW